MVKKVGYTDKEGRLAVFDAGVGDGGPKVRLATAAWPAEHQPALRLSSERFSRLERFLEQLLTFDIGQAAIGVSSLEGDVGKRTQVAVSLEPLRGLRLITGTLAATRHGPPEVWMTHRHIGLNPTRTTANGAPWRFGLLSHRVGRRIAGGTPQS
jgi:hypothetical protein